MGIIGQSEHLTVLRLKPCIAILLKSYTFFRFSVILLSMFLLYSLKTLPTTQIIFKCLKTNQIITHLSFFV